MAKVDVILLLRVLCSIPFIPHIVIKAGRSLPVLNFFRAAGFNPPVPFIFLSIGIELVLAPCLLFGILLPYAAWAAAIFMMSVAVSVFRVSKGQWFWNMGGPEYHVFWALACVIIALGS